MLHLADLLENRVSFASAESSAPTARSTATTARHHSKRTNRIQGPQTPEMNGTKMVTKMKNGCLLHLITTLFDGSTRDGFDLPRYKSMFRIRDGLEKLCQFFQYFSGAMRICQP